MTAMANTHGHVREWLLPGVIGVGLTLLIPLIGICLLLCRGAAIAVGLVVLLAIGLIRVLHPRWRGTPSEEASSDA
jgi:hypothetical protein